MSNQMVVDNNLKALTEYYQSARDHSKCPVTFTATFVVSRSSTRVRRLQRLRAGQAGWSRRPAARPRRRSLSLAGLSEHLRATPVIRTHVHRRSMRYSTTRAHVVDSAKLRSRRKNFVKKSPVPLRDHTRPSVVSIRPNEHENPFPRPRDGAENQLAQIMERNYAAVALRITGSTSSVQFVL